MKFYALTQKGEFHVNHNEDYLVMEDCGKSFKLIAVMDGCSSGTDSHFAATLLGKILRKLAKQEAYREYAEKQHKEIKLMVEHIALSLFEELGTLYRQLDLNSDEVLTTLIMGIINTENNSAEFVIIGDGLIHVDGENFEYESDNKPDYIGYHLNMDKYIWFQTRTYKKSIAKFADLTISTDGIFTFKNHDGKSYPGISEDQIFNEFCKDITNLENPNKLKKSLLKVKNEFGLMPSDDLTMIRIIC
jgi:hypothetical protein